MRPNEGPQATRLSALALFSDHSLLRFPPAEALSLNDKPERARTPFRGLPASLRRELPGHRMMANTRCHCEHALALPAETVIDEEIVALDGSQPGPPGSTLYRTMLRDATIIVELLLTLRSVWTSVESSARAPSFRSAKPCSR